MNDFLDQSSAEHAADDAERAIRLEQAAAVADAIRAKNEGIAAFLGSLGLAVALVGAGAFFEMKGSSASSILAKTELVGQKMSEAEFVARSDFRAAEYAGRLITDPNGLIRFDTGSNFALAKYDAVSGRMVADPVATLGVARLVGDLAFCRLIPGGEPELLKCFALHQGVVIDLDHLP